MNNLGLTVANGISTTLKSEGCMAKGVLRRKTYHEFASAECTQRDVIALVRLTSFELETAESALLPQSSLSVEIECCSGSPS